MSHPNFVILYVDEPAHSVAFYRRLLGCEPVEASPNFAMFALSSGVMLGLWARHDVSPAVAAGRDARGELAIALQERGGVDATYAGWKADGVPMMQDPVDLDFGRTFVALDPDGHRLRVFAA